MNRLRIIFSLFLFFTGSAFSQYMSPMPDYPMVLSANFAEARPNHFHSGIDIKTGGVEGHKIVAVKDGFVSRIAVKPYGYGRVVYITHDDGTTSVYGHISRFIPKLESYVREKRYETKTNNVDLFPSRNQFVFKKGELIAYSGNSGSSGGPHLHFEIRDDASGKTLNILSRGMYEVEDNIPPTIVALYFMAVDTIDGIPMEQRVGTFTPQCLSKGHYVFNTPLKLPSKGYFVLETTDRKDGTQNTMGVYDIIEWVDGTPVYELKLDSFSFTETRCVNSITVFGMQKKSRNEVFRLARQQNCNFSGFKVKRYNGVIDPEKADSVIIEVVDDAGNLSSLSFSVEMDETLSKPSFVKPENSFEAKCKMASSFTVGDMTVRVGEKSLFDSRFMQIEEMDTTGLNLRRALSGIYKVDDETVPYFSAVSISLPSSEDGVVMARYNPRTRSLSSAGGKKDGNNITLGTTTGGYFCLARDTIAPKITPVFPKGFAWASSKSVRFKMSDDFSGVESYSLQIDGKFAILEHIMKQATLVHYFDDNVFGKGKSHKLVLTIKDGAGNRGVYTKTYTR